ncbi:MAG: RNase adapter RapZ [Candidatus Babeliales bacterium]
MNEKKIEIVVVTGYSGAGKSTVLRVLEDVGFFCVDNLPSALLRSFFQLIDNTQIVAHSFGLGLDIRSGDSIEELVVALKEYAELTHYSIKIIFLTANNHVILKRFQETRRNHPLGSIMQIDAAIDYEKGKLAPLLEIADKAIATDQLTSQQLRQLIRALFVESSQSNLVVNLMSFGFKYGMPNDCNFVYDVRSLPNPYFIPALRSFNGTQEPIQEYLFAQQVVQEYWQKLIEFFRYTIEKSDHEGRCFITIAIGCTGGRHRSVAFIHKLSAQEIDKVKFIVTHRDIDRDHY